MSNITIFITEKLNIQSTSNAANRCVSPGGGLYLSGRRPQQDDMRIDSINSSTNSKFTSFVIVGQDSVIEFMPLQGTVTAHSGVTEFEIKQFSSLLNRYTQFQRQTSFAIQGIVEVMLSCAKTNEANADTYTIEINNAADFNKVLELFQQKVMPQQVSKAVTDNLADRPVSALRI